MNAIILAAGRGSRMKDLTSEKPKCLLQIDGSTLLEKQIKNFRNKGIKKIAIVTGYKSNLIIRKDITEFHNDKWDQTNMVYSLLKADEWLSSSECIISYGDIFYEESAIDILKNCSSEIAITYDINWFDLWSNRFEDPLSDAEIFQINEENNLLKIGYKTKNYKNIQGQFMGLLKINSQGWSKIKNAINFLEISELKNIDMTSLLMLLIKNYEQEIKCLKYKDKWGEIDSPEDLLLYNQ